MQIVDYLNGNLKKHQDKTFFTFEGTDISYALTSLSSKRFAGQLTTRGVKQGDFIVLDVPTSPDFIFVLFAASFLGVTVILMNQRLTPAEKKRYLEGVPTACYLDEEALCSLKRLEPSPYEEGFHEGLFNSDLPFIGVFTSGTTGTPKLALLTQRNTISSAAGSVCFFDLDEDTLYQACLPLFHVGGLQIVFRTLVAQGSFILYPSYNIDALLADLNNRPVTDISVVEKTLLDIIETDAAAAKKYRHVLLGGASIKQSVLDKASGLNLFVSYGSTEGASTIAANSAERYQDEGLIVLPSFSTKIIDVNEQEEGQLAIAGAPVFSGYYQAGSSLNVSDFDSEGYFLTGDQAVYSKDGIFVRERLKDMFISGGENIYPTEIENILMQERSVAEAVVIGVPDEKWGRVPVAFVTGDDLDIEALRELSENRLSKIKRPREIIRADGFTKTALGKTDKQAMEALYDKRIKVQKVIIYRIDQPLVKPFETASGVLSHRESLIIEVIDHKGHKGLGECTSFATNWYMEETIPQDLEILQNRLIPLVLDTVYISPFGVFDSFKTWGIEFPQAAAALETALWDLYGHITSSPMYRLLGGTSDPVPVGVVLGIMSIEETVKEARRYVDAGYRRLKLKIKPDDDIERLRAVRAEFPDIQLMADANQAYGKDDIAKIRALDECGLVCLEEPFKDASLSELSELQAEFATPICLDESLVNFEDYLEALEYPRLAFFNVKVGKLGGVLPALRFCAKAAQQQATVWMGGMYETSISKRLSAAFETIPIITVPGDISQTDRYFEHDIALPVFHVENGMVHFDENFGIGVELNEDYLHKILIEKIEAEHDVF